MSKVEINVFSNDYLDTTYLLLMQMKDERERIKNVPNERAQARQAASVGVRRCLDSA
jgi:hypothetical protein